MVREGWKAPGPAGTGWTQAPAEPAVGMQYETAEAHPSLTKKPSSPLLPLA